MTITEKTAYLKGLLEGMAIDQATNEGKLLAVVSPDRAEDALAALKRTPGGEDAAIIGTVTDRYPGKLVLKTCLGGGRVLTRLTGAQLPRIC